jgi:ribonuclease BN (tRNA processing enzyme)
MTRAFLEQNAYDIETRIADEGRVALAPLVRPHEITRGGAVFRDQRLSVTAALVHHPPVEPAFAYRLDGPDRSVVISGDTARSEALIALARGADVLVHEALAPGAVDRIVGAVEGGEKLKAHILQSHTPVEEVGRVAQEAGVKKLVLSHLVPSDDPEVSEAAWLEGARRHFRGEVVVGADLMEV